MTAAAKAVATTSNHSAVSADRWLAERRTLLAREKALIQLQDEIARARRALPWKRVAKDYVFAAPVEHTV